MFGGRDPFAEFGGGAMDLFGGSPFGNFGSIMKQFDDLGRSGGNNGGMNMMNIGNGQYSSQSFAMCSRMGPDGKMHSERFASSEVGNRGQKIREAQQAYSNSTTGIDKMGFERQLGDQGRKIVRERNRHTAEEKSTELFKGMEESQRDQFDQRFASNSKHLPQHPNFNVQALAAGDTRRRQPALAHGRNNGEVTGKIGAPSGAVTRHRSAPGRH